MSALAWRLGFGRRPEAPRDPVAPRDVRLDQLDPDQRVREIGEW